MIEILIYTASGILLYVLADACLNYIEKLHGEPIPYRHVVFFIMILTMALILFQLIRLTFTGDGQSQ